MTYPRKPKPADAARTGSSTLKETIRAMLDTYRLQGKFRETHVVNAWGRLMGPPIASRTHRVFVRDQKLYVHLTSAPLKHQLSMAKTKIVAMLNQDVGEEVITEVVFL